MARIWAAGIFLTLLMGGLVACCRPFLRAMEAAGRFVLAVSGPNAGDVDFFTPSENSLPLADYFTYINDIGALRNWPVPHGPKRRRRG